MQGKFEILWKHAELVKKAGNNQALMYELFDENWNQMLEEWDLFDDIS